MEALKEICKKDGRYKEVIKESYIVKNAVILLGGRRRGNGGGKEMECKEMGVGEKVKLIELLSELVKGGVEMREEEEMVDVLMELEEEGNRHVEEEMEEGEGEGEGEGREGNKEEKREWEELSQRAHELIWRMEGVKNRREGKKRDTLKMMKKREEEMEKRIEEERRGREEANKNMEQEKRMKEEEKKRDLEEKRVLEERIERMEKEMERMKKEGGIATLQPTHSSTPNIITSLDGTSVIFPQTDRIRREGNTIIHYGKDSFRNCFIGGVMTSVYSIFSSSIIHSFSLSIFFSLFYRESIGCMHHSHSSFSLSFHLSQHFHPSSLLRYLFLTLPSSSSSSLSYPF